MSILAIDIGTTTFRVAEVTGDGELVQMLRRTTPLSQPVPGLAELDAQALFEQVLAGCEEVSAAAVAAGRAIDGLGIATQRATTVVWDQTTAAPVGPALSWNDLRTVEHCMTLQAQGLTLAPNESATKIAWLVDAAAVQGTSTDNLLSGTLDSWLLWCLTQGEAHVTDRSNAGVSGLLRTDAQDWDDHALELLDLPRTMLPELVDSIGAVGQATALTGAPAITAIVGDQQSSLAGQAAFGNGVAKATFGTGAAVDICMGSNRPDFERRGPQGCFPIICWTTEGEFVWGVEALDLAAGSCVSWLGQQWGLFDDPAQSETLAQDCDDSGGVVFVPALEGLGAPTWDFGARGAFLGLTRGTERSHLARAVLEGVAARGADLVAAARQDIGAPGAELAVLRVDGGMSRNRVFTQALADAAQLPVEVASEPESTVLGAAYLAGLPLGCWSSWSDIEQLYQPQAVIEPRDQFNQDRWRSAVEQSLGWEDSLSEISFW